MSKSFLIYLDSFEEVNLKDMVIKPKTIKDLQANTRVLNALNKNHKDDIFSSNKTKKKEVPKVWYMLTLSRLSGFLIDNFLKFD